MGRWTKEGQTEVDKFQPERKTGTRENLKGGGVVELLRYSAIKLTPKITSLEHFPC